MDWAQLYASYKSQVVGGAQLSFSQDFFLKFYQAFVGGDRWKLYLRGVGTTIEVTFFALLLGVLLEEIGNGEKRLLPLRRGRIAPLLERRGRDRGGGIL